MGGFSEEHCITKFLNNKKWTQKNIMLIIIAIKYKNWKKHCESKWNYMYDTFFFIIVLVFRNITVLSFSYGIANAQSLFTEIVLHIKAILKLW